MGYVELLSPIVICKHILVEWVDFATFHMPIISLLVLSLVLHSPNMEFEGDGIGLTSRIPPHNLKMSNLRTGTDPSSSSCLSAPLGHGPDALSQLFQLQTESLVKTSRVMFITSLLRSIGTDNSENSRPSNQISQNCCGLPFLLTGAASILYTRAIYLIHISWVFYRCR